MEDGNNDVNRDDECVFLSQLHRRACLLDRFKSLYYIIIIIRINKSAARQISLSLYIYIHTHTHSGHLKCSSSTPCSPQTRPSQGGVRQRRLVKGEGGGGATWQIPEITLPQTKATSSCDVVFLVTGPQILKYTLGP
jgi:hypothetical protein